MMSGHQAIFLEVLLCKRKTKHGGAGLQGEFFRLHEAWAFFKMLIRSIHRTKGIEYFLYN